MKTITISFPNSLIEGITKCVKIINNPLERPSDDQLMQEFIQVRRLLINPANNLLFIDPWLYEDEVLEKTIRR